MLLNHSQYSRVVQDAPHRINQCLILNTYLSSDPEIMPSSLLVHGIASTGKSYLTRKILDESHIKYTWINCPQCISTRILLQRILRGIQKDSDVDLSESNKANNEGKLIVAGEEYNRYDIYCENFTYFAAELELFITKYNYTGRGHILVLDNIDEMEIDLNEIQQIISCFLKLNEMTNNRTKNFTIIFIMKGGNFGRIGSTMNSIPTVYFPTYQDDEILDVLNRDIIRLPNDCFDSNLSESERELEQKKFWNNFIKVTYSAKKQFTGSNIIVLRDIIQKIWPLFTRRIISGERTVNDFTKLLREERNIFSGSFGCDVSLVDDMNENDSGVAYEDTSIEYELPLFSKYILCAAYLASYIPSKYDITIFSKTGQIRKGKRHMTSSKRKLKIDRKNLSPPSFDLERLFAILKSLLNESGISELNDNVNNFNDKNEAWLAKGTEIGIRTNVDLMQQVANLLTLKLLTKTGFDSLGERSRWRVNVGWDEIRKVASTIDLGIEGYVMEIDGTK